MFIVLTICGSEYGFYCQSQVYCQMRVRCTDINNRFIVYLLYFNSKDTNFPQTANYPSIQFAVLKVKSVNFTLKSMLQQDFNFKATKLIQTYIKIKLKWN